VHLEHLGDTRDACNMVKERDHLGDSDENNGIICKVVE
jgi:hypothetical protein